MPVSLGYNFLSILCDEGSGYIRLYPMRACTMNEVQIDAIFNHQMEMYKKIFENSDSILKNRQRKISTLNTKFTVGALVFRLDEKGPREISHPKQLPSWYVSSPSQMHLVWFISGCLKFHLVWFSLV